MSDLLSILRDSGAKPLYENSVWELSLPSLLRWRKYQQVQGARTNLLREFFRRTDSLVLVYSENPVEDCLRGDWRDAGSLQWKVSTSSVDLSELEKWLCLGDWMLCDSKSPLPADTLDRLSLWSPEFAVARASELGITSLIHADKDNDPWRVLVIRSNRSGQVSIVSPSR
jgi:hypothetical protein